MRTRIFNKMTAKEVEDYLARGGDTIFVPVGVVECHSAMPIDVEQIVPEAYALLMAEKADGLAMINLPYFFPGGTVVSSSTVQVTVRQSIDYLMGLRGPRPANFVRKEYEEMSAGAYKILGKLDEVPIDPNAEYVPYDDSMNPPMYRLQKALSTVGAQTSMMYKSWEYHVPCRAYHSREELLEAAENSERQMRAAVDAIDFEEIKAALDGYYDYLKDLAEKNPRLKGQY